MAGTSTSAKATEAEVASESREADPDRKLVAAILNKNRKAAAEFVSKYSDPVYRYARYRLMPRIDMVDDLVQEVFLCLWNRSDQWECRGTLQGWLLRIGTNLAYNHLRSVRRRREQPIEPVPWSGGGEEEDDALTPGWLVDDASLGPDALAEQRERRQWLERRIDELPEEKREVVRMVHDAEMEMREVAERLGVPEGTVKSRLYHARKELAEQWRKIETDSGETE